MHYPTVLKIARFLPKRVKIWSTRLYHDVGLIALCKNWIRVMLDRWGVKQDKGNFMVHMRNGLKVEVESCTLDLQVLAEIFWEHEYTPAFLRRYWDNPKIVCDIGANKGFFALYAAWKFPEARIYGYEPDPDLCKRAIRNVEINALQNQIVIHNLAVYGQKSRLLFQRATGPNRGTGKVVAANPSSYEVDTISVDAVTLTDLVNEIGNIDLLKIDVEGAEYSIITHDHLDALKRVGYIALEWHTVPGYELDQIVTVLRAAGFRVHILRRKAYACRL